MRTLDERATERAFHQNRNSGVEKSATPLLPIQAEADLARSVSGVLLTLHASDHAESWGCDVKLVPR